MTCLIFKKAITAQISAAVDVNRPIRGALNRYKKNIPVKKNGRDFDLPFSAFSDAAGVCLPFGQNEKMSIRTDKRMMAIREKIGK